MHLLEIALREELNKEQVGPDSHEVEWLGRVRDVCQVEHELDEELFVFALCGVELLILHTAGQLSKFDEMLSHVSR